MAFYVTVMLSRCHFIVNDTEFWFSGVYVDLCEAQKIVPVKKVKIVKKKPKILELPKEEKCVGKGATKDLAKFL